MKKIKVWEKPEICLLSVEKTENGGGPGDGPQPNDVWCPVHNKYHGNDHSKGCIS